MTDLARANASWAEQAAVRALPARVDTTERLRAWVELFRDVYKASEVLAQTAFVPQGMINKPQDVAAAIMKGYELGMDPLDALANIYVVHGRIGFYAEFQRRRIIQAGHTFRVIESSDTRCIVEGARKEGGEPQRASFSADQARKANLNLGAYPADKLVARATSRLCRQVFPDVLSGTLIVEDIIDGLIPAADDKTPTPDPSKPSGLTRQRKPRTPKPAPQPEPDENPRLEAAKAKAAQAHEIIFGGAGRPDDNEDLLDDEDGPVGAEAPDKPAADEPAAPAPTPQTLIDYTTPEPPATKKQTDRIHAMLNDLGITDSDDRHTIITHITQAPCTNTNQLTRGEATKVIDRLLEWYRDDQTPIADRLNEILNQAAIEQAEQDNDADDG